MFSVNVDYVGLLQSGKRSRTCFYTYTHKCYTGKGFQIHGSPCGWCKGYCPQSTCHSVGSGAGAEGPELAGLELECSADCYWYWAYWCGHCGHCWALPRDYSSFDCVLAGNRGWLERNSEEYLLTQLKLLQVQQAAVSWKAFHLDRKQRRERLDFGFRAASWTTVLLTWRAGLKDYPPWGLVDLLASHRSESFLSCSRTPQSGYWGFREWNH